MKTETNTYPGPAVSPWGAVEFKTEIASGIWRVSTPSHGGLWLSPERWEGLFYAFPAFRARSGTGWLEEDCEYGAAVLAFPADFDDDMLTDGVNLAKHKWLPGIAAEDIPAEILARMEARQAALVSAGLWVCGSRGTHKDGWWLDIRSWATGECRTVIVAEYPTERHLTPEQVAALPLA